MSPSTRILHTPLGGAETDPLTTIDAIEAIAAADGAAGWVLMIGVAVFGIVSLQRIGISRFPRA